MIRSVVSYLNSKKYDPKDPEKKEINPGSLFTIPNFITLFRLIIIVPAGAAFVQRYGFLFMVLVLVFAMGDILDGYLAFVLNQRTRLGRIFDSLVDKLFLLVLLGLALIFRLVAPWFILTIIFINIVQLVFTWSKLAVDKNKNFPKTYLGPLISLFFMASVFVASKLVVLLYITTVIMSINHLYYYLKGLYPAGVNRLKERLLFFSTKLNHIWKNSKITQGTARYYHDKITNRNQNHVIKEKRHGLTLANLVTVFRITLILPVIYFYQAGWYITAVLLIILFVFLDFVDGYIARKLSQVTKTGQILDAFTDKFGFFVFLIFCFLENRIPGWLFVLICLRIIFIFIMAGLVFFFAKASLPIAYFSLVSAVSLVAYILFPSDFLLLVTAILTIQLVINYLYQSFIAVKQSDFSFNKERGNILPTG